MAVISAARRVTDTSAVTVFTASADCTVSLDITNCVDSPVTLRVLYTPTPETQIPDNPAGGHVLESHTQLAGHGVLSRNGLPVKAGWAFTVQAEGDAVHLSTLVSGYTV